MNEKLLNTCNNCLYLSPTEEEQNKLHRLGIRKPPHMCLKYNIQVLHNSGGKNHDENIYPCPECESKRELHQEIKKRVEVSHDDLVPIGSVWKHYKGNIYEVVGFATDCDTCATLVLYRSPKNPEITWARKLREFLSYVDESKYPYLPNLERFKYVGSSMDSPEVKELLESSPKYRK